LVLKLIYIYPNIGSYFVVTFGSYFVVTFGSTFALGPEGPKEKGGKN
jgi:hypothetical protein